MTDLINISTRRLICYSIVSILACGFATECSAKEEVHASLDYLSAPAELEPEPVAEINYAPDRKADIEHLALDVTPNFEKRTVTGTASFTFSPIGKPLDEMRLDAIDLTVEDVTCSAKLAGYQVGDKEIIISFAEPIAPGKQTRLTIRYSAQPAKGMYFRVPSNGYPAKDTHMFTQGEMIEARHWFPSYDYPNEKFTSEITCHVPEGMTVLSNGRQVESKKDANSKLIAVHWVQDKPHVNYLITLAAGYFAKIDDVYKDIPLSFYTPPSDAQEAPLTFKDTKPAMQFFEMKLEYRFHGLSMGKWWCGISLMAAWKTQLLRP